MKKLTEDFLYELFKLIFKNKAVLELSKQHIKYHFLPSEAFKKIFKSLTNFYSAKNSIPSYGIVAQMNNDDKDVINTISKIKTAQNVNKESLILSLETFVKQAKFIEMYDKVATIYNSGKQDQAINILSETSNEIVNFSITKDTNYYEKIFGDFEKRYLERKVKLDSEKPKEKIPIGICEVDAELRGGIDESDIVLFLGDSGMGKTKLLRWAGVSAARRGYNVLHVQAEGSEKECKRGYDSTWTGLKNSIIENSDIPSDLIEKLKKAINNITSNGGEIYVHAFEKFDSATIREVRDILEDFEKRGIHIDLVLLDYFELFDPGDGKKYKVSEERERRRSISRRMKNLAIEYKTRFITCTQSSDISPKLKEDPDFVRTRHHISEFKNALEPFSVFITMNQTKDEKDNDVMRLYFDKLRNYKGNKICKIFQSYKNDRFYDKKRTREEFYFPEL